MSFGSAIADRRFCYRARWLVARGWSSPMGIKANSIDRVSSRMLSKASGLIRSTTLTVKETLRSHDVGLSHDATSSPTDPSRQILSSSERTLFSRRATRLSRCTCRSAASRSSKKSHVFVNSPYAPAEARARCCNNFDVAQGYTQCFAQLRHISESRFSGLGFLAIRYRYS